MPYPSIYFRIYLYFFFSLDYNLYLFYSLDYIYYLQKKNVEYNSLSYKYKYHLLYVMEDNQ